MHVIDDATIAIPGTAGQQAHRWLPQRPAAAAGRHAVPDPGRGDTILALEIDVDEVFFLCPKAFLRSDAWQPQTWNPDAVPSVARLAKAIKPDTSDEQLTEYYSEANLRKILY